MENWKFYHRVTERVGNLPASEASKICSISYLSNIREMMGSDPI